jgi:hypothetical protein
MKMIGAMEATMTEQDVHEQRRDGCGILTPPTTDRLERRMPHLET